MADGDDFGLWFRVGGEDSLPTPPAKPFHVCRELGRVTVGGQEGQRVKPTLHPVPVVGGVRIDVNFDADHISQVLAVCASPPSSDRREVRAMTTCGGGSVSGQPELWFTNGRAADGMRP